MAIFGTIVKVLQVPAIANLVQLLTGKLLSRIGREDNKGIDPKVTAFGLPFLIVEAALFAAKQFDPGLSALLEPARSTILEFAALVGAVLAYYTPNASSPSE